MKRLCFLGLLVFALGISNGRALTKITLVTDWYPQAEHGGFYQALIKGYYKDAGLDVEISPGGPAVNGPQRVATGRAQFSLGAGDDVMVGRSHGLPLVAVGATMQYDVIALMVHASSDVKKFEDLENKTISVGAGACWFQYLLKKFAFKSVKVRPLTFSIANFMNDPTYIQQCFITSEPFFVRKAGVEPRVLLTRDAGYPNYRVYFTTDDFAQKNPELVRGFVAASCRGWKEYLSTPTEADKEILRRNPEMTQDLLNYSREQLIQFGIITGDPAKGEGIGKFDAARWKTQAAQLKALGLIKADLDETKAFTTEFLPK
jgi:NitT/TauT family transport system substrate-binding protein